MKDIIPGAFTLGNMFCGFLSVLFSVEGNLVTAAWLVVLAGFLDGLDGKLAQALGSTSQFGIELDSFADVISFGLAPGVLFYSSEHIILGKWVWVLGFIFIAAGAFRLVRFNLRTEFETKDFFNGLPITAAAMTLASYFLFSHGVWGEMRYVGIVILILLFFSALMVSNIKYDNLPNFSFDNQWNRIKLLYVFVGIVAILIKPKIAPFPLGMMYVLSGVIRGINDLFSTNRIRTN
ncbi:MAG TPA: CDP-diacylglycerol--serine O-phosphatidyltransferase [candidate division Zixibacteria bacterium]